MSDINIDFPIWVFAGLILAYALPVTTALLAPLVFARVFGGRQGTGRGARSLALDVAILVLAPPWLIGVVGWVWFGIDWLGGWPG